MSCECNHLCAAFKLSRRVVVFLLDHCRSRLWHVESHLIVAFVTPFVSHRKCKRSFANSARSWQTCQKDDLPSRDDPWVLRLLKVAGCKMRTFQFRIQASMGKRATSTNVNRLVRTH